jgi:hypothetical protein
MKKSRANETYEKIRLLKLATPRVRKSIIRDADKSLLNAISECCLNVLHGRVPLSSKQKLRLSKHKNELRKLAEKRAGVRKRKRVLVQSGDGFLTALIGPVAALLGGLLSSRR